ncbi:MAG: 50S ribosomal protein L24 [Omnitrophica WOR_2 bacterium RIFCSPLOWO2_12_FULL_46_30]|nr:MAG: 50S ribosomal protein L24 [Omnitrophica WOR_2 bacterium RIFCSPHIGHO2_02_FULL_46_37]OGX43028.1 MAG: 50S ribosomal protein L24 [Omnitrophica WOR_2 bacterium RIFCSPLOWO2_02_FULL_45_28]OGX49895.1 MAG: 50S ribosomal protein L24 [Omnitrophica WOR_2 bacterium RIFCSPLOWO2_12_FULL_46_30]
MLRIKKNDIVMVTSGKDKGKTGKVLFIARDLTRAAVSGINLVKKHMRKTQENQQGGVVQVERPVSLSNIMPFCKNCNRPVRVGISISKDKTKLRICKKCKQPL